MERVRTRAGNHVDHRRSGEAVLRAEVRLLHLKFFHRFDWRIVGHLRDSAVGLNVRNRRAIQQNIGRTGAAAIGDKTGVVAIVALVVHVGNAGRQISQFGRIAADER